MNKLTAHWKTTVQSILTSVIGLPALALTPPFSTLLSVKITGYIAVAAVIAKVVLGFFQQDAGTQLAYVPGKGVQAEPAHQVPDNPAAKPVTE